MRAVLELPCFSFRRVTSDLRLPWCTSMECFPQVYQTTVVKHNVIKILCASKGITSLCFLK